LKGGGWEEQAQNVVEKKELSELAARRYVGREKYMQWQQGRAVQPKPKNTLPILKARFPSAFGS
jgi:hypothetical protein